ncbi:hypothetical protein N9L29_00865 [Litoricolaceae bacterium]|nr:hypothetical protein [Litorivicinaceae bacterium]
MLFLVFNRPDTTARVFEAIRKAEPPRLYVAGDGPRADRKDDADKVAKVREISTAVDWPCEVKTLFREENLGCKYAVTGGITWFFEHEESGIVLEDDCLPSQSFFWFCEQMLADHKHDETIDLISGDGGIIEAINLPEESVLLPYPLMWGWASWAHKWSGYDVEMESWPANKSTILSAHRKGNRVFWRTAFEKTFEKEIDTWDYQLAYMLQKNRTNCLLPPKNLIRNIGFNRDDATHTTGSGEGYVFQEKEIVLPAVLSNSIANQKLAKKYADENLFLSKSFISRLANYIWRVFKRNLQLGRGL